MGRRKKGKSQPKKKRKTPKVRLYYATPRRYRVGQVIRPSALGKGRLWQYHFTGVFCTTREEPHYTILPATIKDGWHVYEVRPEGKVKYGRMWDEVQVEAVEVVRYVGTARGIVRLHKRRKVLGSKVYPHEVAAVRRRKKR